MRSNEDELFDLCMDTVDKLSFLFFQPTLPHHTRGYVGMVMGNINYKIFDLYMKEDITHPPLG